MKNSRDVEDGPLAFPVSQEKFCTTGMSLRDYFAIRAMEPLRADMSYTSEDFDKRALLAYSYADAMLRARESNTK